MQRNHEIVKRLIALNNEKKKRQEADFLSRYNTGEKVHKKQIEFHKCPKKNRWVFGGNRSGKTECGAVECVYISRGVHPYRENRKNTFGWVVSLTTQVQREVAQAKILQYLNPYWIQDIVMQSGRKDAPHLGVIDQIHVKTCLAVCRLSALSLATKAEKDFKAVRLISCGLMKNHPKIFTMSA